MAATPEVVLHYSRHNSFFWSYMRRNNLVGQRFERLVVVGDAGICSKHNVRWECVCDCGGRAVAYAYDLRAGKVKSCGCLAREGANTKHGLARGGKRRSRVYSIWATMVQRCTNPNDRAYANYGARGIKVCRRWMSFENFFADMGEPAPEQSLERANNDKGYSPNNCYWASRAEQARNKRSTVRVCVDGTEMVLTDALRLLGVSLGALHYWMKKLNLTHQEGVELWHRRRKNL